MRGVYKGQFFSDLIAGKRNILWFPPDRYYRRRGPRRLSEPFKPSYYKGPPEKQKNPRAINCYDPKRNRKKKS